MGNSIKCAINCNYRIAAEIPIYHKNMICLRNITVIIPLEDNNNNNNNETQVPQNSDDPRYVPILPVISCISPTRSLADSCFETKRVG
jgi:hypothetical protein